MQIISATDLARHTRKILDQVTQSGESLAIERNHVTIAKIIPPEKTMTARHALAGLTPMLTHQQSSDWLKDSREEFNQAVRDPWE